MSDSLPEGASHPIKQIKMLAKSEGLMARVFTLAPGEIIDWHQHSEVTDWYVCLQGLLRVETRSPDRYDLVQPGKMTNVPPSTPHHVSNLGDGDCEFLLLQGVGKFDFLPLDD